MKMRSQRVLAITAGALALALAVSACTPGGPTTPSSTTTATTPTAPVTLTMWSWDPNMDQIVTVWNAANPDIQIKLENPAGGDELMARVLTAHKAGQAPDILKVEYQALPSMIANGVAADITSYVPDAATKFTAGALAATTFEGKVYGLPQDFAPLVFFYRADILAQYKIKVPTTWDEYAQAARALHAANKSLYLGNFSSNDPGWFAGLAQQAGAQWWTTQGDAWKVTINDSASKKVADYWGGLVSEGVVSGEPNWSTEWNKLMDGGQIAGWVSGAWAPAQFGGIAPNTAGKWTMTNAPAWTAGDATTGVWGGSATIVTTDSKYPAQAAKFIDWFNGTDDGWKQQIAKINIFPSLISAQKLPDLGTPPKFMSNQPTYYADVAKIAETTHSFGVWGPNATVTFSAYTDGFKNAITNKTAFSAVLDDMQAKSVADMKAQGFNVV